MKASNRKVGRPKSGKEQFCIRMAPKAKAALTRTARAAGYTRLGDWLETLAQADVAAGALDLDGMSSVELANSFRVACNRAATALSTVLEVLDYAPVVGKDGLKAFRSLKDRYQRIMRLARNVEIWDK